MGFSPRERFIEMEEEHSLAYPPRPSLDGGEELDSNETFLSDVSSDEDDDIPSLGSSSIFYSDIDTLDNVSSTDSVSSFNNIAMEVVTEADYSSNDSGSIFNNTIMVMEDGINTEAMEDGDIPVTMEDTINGSRAGSTDSSNNVAVEPTSSNNNNFPVSVDQSSTSAYSTSPAIDVVSSGLASSTSAPNTSVSASSVSVAFINIAAVEQEENNNLETGNI